MERLKRFFYKTPVRIAVVVLGALFVAFGVWALAKGYINVPCPVYYFTGILCPGCGTGRAAKALLRLDVITAFRCNPFTVTAMPFCLFYIVKFTVKYLAGKKMEEKTNFPDVIIYVYLGLWLLFSILRNIPVYPFTLLLPPV